MSKIAVIGACSYIAQNFINQNSAHDFYLYDRQTEHPHQNASYKQLDILNLDDIAKINFACDQIIIFAGLTGTAAGFDNYTAFITVNEVGLLNILDGYVKHKSKARIVFPSTRLVYKGLEGRGLREDDEKEFKSIYAANKFACEAYLKMYHEMFGVDYTVFRICVPYGSGIYQGSSYGTIEWMVNTAKAGKDIVLYGDGSQRRTFTHINDICAVIALGGQDARCSGDVFNIGGEDLSLHEAAHKIAERYRVGVTCTPWPELASKMESGHTVFNSLKLDALIKYQHKISFNEWIATL